MATITISRARYDDLVSAKEDLEDILAYDRAMADEHDGLPQEFMVRLIDGEKPLAVFREWRGLSQAGLSKLSGVNRIQIIDIESGRNTG
ncbi:MAG: helix-turn-helix transcriptional regulator, partial [Kiloniellales bacterium]|nr:helix-turn-helix transcriptional regulator [Kiloniellales bacterium]